MPIWDEKPSSVAMHQKSTPQPKKMDYSQCPLKKRPVNFDFVKHEHIKQEMDFVNSADDCAEPENLSTKPQDLSVKYRSAVAAAVTPAVKREPPSSYQAHHEIATPPPSPAYQYLAQNHHPQHPYQPMPIKPGPLEPLCLNIAAAGDYHPHPISIQQQQQQQHQTMAYHHHHHHHQRHYAAAGPRTVPAQYPSTGYLAGYNVYQAVQPGPLQYSPTVIGTTVVMRARDPSLSPAAISTGSAFKPLQHASPPAAVVATAFNGSPNGGGGSTVDVMSPPRTLSLSSLSPSTTAASPSYGLPPPPPAMYLNQMPAAAAAVSIDCASNSNHTVSSPNNSVQTYGAAIVPSRKPVIMSVASSSTGVAVGRYKCSRCAKTYSTSSGLTKHQHYHCVALDERPGPDASSAAAAKTFCCKYCDKAYNTMGALKMHIRTHTLPCICNLCGKAFSRPWLLQGHIRTHTGEKPFSCAFCNRAFADRSNLRAHLQTHSDVKKYSCPSCCKTFSRMSLLTKHCDTGCRPRSAVPDDTEPAAPQQQFKAEPGLTQ